MGIQSRFRRGLPKSSARISIVAAASGTLVYSLSAGRTARIVKIKGYNGQAAPITLTFGTGLAGAFVQSMSPLYVVNGMDFEFTEDQIPDMEFVASITASASAAAAAPNDIQVEIEVEEFQGPTG